MPTIEPYTYMFDLPNARLVIAQSIVIITTNLATKVELSTEKMYLGLDRDKIIKKAKINIEIGLLRFLNPLAESKSVIWLNHIDAQIMNKNPATNISEIASEKIMFAICESVLSNFTPIRIDRIM